jgi:hypothetical protein
VAPERVEAEADEEAHAERRDVQVALGDEVGPERHHVGERNVHRDGPREREGGERRAACRERAADDRDHHDGDAAEHGTVADPVGTRRRIVRAEGQREDEEPRE